jgi:hypothetical protein
MSKRRSLCYIDDDAGDLARFKKAMGDDYFVGVGTSVTRALDDLKTVQDANSSWARRLWAHHVKDLICGRRVDLFVLDMYFPREGKNSPEELAELDKAWDQFRKAERSLRKVLSDLGQDIDGGLRLAKEVKSRGWHSRTPFVFFTRKGNLLGAITAYEHTDALAVVKKPDPREGFDELHRSAVYDNAMIEDKTSLTRAFDSAIHKASFRYRYKGHIEGFITGFASSLLVWVVTWLLPRWAG